MKEKKALNTVILVFQILVLIVIAASFAFYIPTLISYYKDTLNPPEINLSGLGYAFILIFSIISNAISLILSLIPFIISLIHRRSSKRLRNIIFSSVLLASPFVLQGIVLLVGVITGVLGP